MLFTLLPTKLLGERNQFLGGCVVELLLKGDVILSRANLAAFGLVPACFSGSVSFFILLEDCLHAKRFECHVASLEVDLVAVENVVGQAVRFGVRGASVIVDWGLGGCNRRVAHQELLVEHLGKRRVHEVFLGDTILTFPLANLPSLFPPAPCLDFLRLLLHNVVNRNVYVVVDIAT